VRGREGESLWALKRWQGDQASWPTCPLGRTLPPRGCGFEGGGILVAVQLEHSTDDSEDSEVNRRRTVPEWHGPGGMRTMLHSPTI
jgi:hypothetical protein